MHILAYLFDPRDEDLAGEMAEIRESRLYRARAMVDKLAKLGAPVTWDQVSEIAGGGVVGRPHVARALVAAGRGPGLRGRVHQRVDWAGRTRACIAVRAGPGEGDPAGAVGRRGDGASPPAWPYPRLADPGRGHRRHGRVGLTGVEVNHPQQDDGERTRLLALCARLALVASGGSDDHGALTGYRIGTEVAPDGGYEQLVGRATGASASDRFVTLRATADPAVRVRLARAAGTG